MDHFLFPKIYLIEELLITVWSVILIITAYDDMNPWWGLTSFWVFTIFELCSYILIMLMELFMVFTMIPMICGTMSYTPGENMARQERGVGNLSQMKKEQDESVQLAKSGKNKEGEMDPELEYRQHGFDVTGAVLPTEERGIYFDAIIEEMVDEVGDIPKTPPKRNIPS